MTWFCKKYKVYNNIVLQNPILFHSACINHNTELAYWLYEQYKRPYDIISHIDATFAQLCRNWMENISIKALIIPAIMHIIEWLITLYPDRYSIHISRKNLLRYWTITKTIHYEHTQVLERACIESNPCPICYNAPSNVQILDCQHKYCSICINKWNNSKDTCPLCRTQMTRFARLEHT